MDVTLQAVSSDSDGTTGTGEYLGGFKDWAIASTAKILPLFIEPFTFTIDTRLTPWSQTFTPRVNNNADNDFAVDWGDASPLEARTNATRNDAYTYEDDGKYTVKIIGTMPSAMSFLYDRKLTSVQSGFLENTASTMQDYFNYCENLETIPSTLFAKSTAVTNFYFTFYQCRSLISIPADLFKKNTKVTNFQGTFYACSSIASIPADLFKYNTVVTNFLSTFNGCSNLTGSIPTGLFETNTKVTTFQETFNNSGITLIPVGLFDNNPAVKNFSNTFNGCSAVTGYLPELWTSHTTATHTNTFTGCVQATNLQDAIDNEWATVTP